MQIWEGKCSQRSSYPWQLKHSHGTSLPCSHFMDLSLFEVNFYRFSDRKISSASFPPASAAKHQHATGKNLSKWHLKEKNLIKRLFFCFGMVWKLSTSAASCILFCWFSSNKPFCLFLKEQILVLLLALIHNNWRFQQHTTQTGFCWSYGRKKTSYTKSSHSLLQVSASKQCSLGTVGAALLLWWDYLRPLMEKGLYLMFALWLSGWKT